MLPNNSVGIVPDLGIYSSMISYYASQLDIEQVFVQLRELRKAGYKPRPRLYVTLAHFFAALVPRIGHQIEGLTLVFTVSFQ
jgi:hypothetical protein